MRVAFYREEDSSPFGGSFGEQELKGATTPIVNN